MLLYLYLLQVCSIQEAKVNRYDLYKLEVYSADNSKDKLFTFGPLPPIVTELVDAPVQKLTVMLAGVELSDNTPFSLQIIALNSQGEKPFDERIHFSELESCVCPYVYVCTSHALLVENNYRVYNISKNVLTLQCDIIRGLS